MFPLSEAESEADITRRRYSVREFKMAHNSSIFSLDRLTISCEIGALPRTIVSMQDVSAHFATRIDSLLCFIDGVAQCLAERSWCGDGLL